MEPKNTKNLSSINVLYIATFLVYSAEWESVVWIKRTPYLCLHHYVPASEDSTQLVIFNISTLHIIDM